MSTRSYQMTFGPGETHVLPAGVFFLVKSAASAVTIETRGTPGSPTRFEGVGAGLSYGPVPPDRKWTYLDVTSAAAQTVEIVVSEESEVKVGNVVSVSGSVSIAVLPSSSIASPARIAVGTGADVQIAAANAFRKRLRVQVPADEDFPVNVGPAGSVATDRGLEIQPGTNEPIDTTAAVFARATSGTVNVQVFEET